MGLRWELHEARDKQRQVRVVQFSTGLSGSCRFPHIAKALSTLGKVRVYCCKIAIHQFRIFSKREAGLSGHTESS